MKADSKASYSDLMVSATSLRIHIIVAIAVRHYSCFEDTNFRLRTSQIRVVYCIDLYFQWLNRYLNSIQVLSMAFYSAYCFPKFLIIQEVPETNSSYLPLYIKISDLSFED